MTDLGWRAMADVDLLRTEAEAAIAAAGSSAELEDLRVRYLGRKSELTQTLRSIGELPPEQRGPVGKAANQARVALETLLDARTGQLEDSELERRLVDDRVDVTLPGDPPERVGALHLITQTRREIEDFFAGLGFLVEHGPEVEWDYYNFTALNHPPAHPARMLQDTFYFSSDVLLRTHTSPMQVRMMEAQEPPLYYVFTGKTYRRDNDATHTPMFHQCEGLAIDEDLTLGDLQGVLLAFSRAMFGPDRQVRLRPHFFPFTEPSIECDVSCFQCGGSGLLPGGARDPLCKGEGWLEILGAGMVDPNVLGFVARNGYDPEKVQGWAWGMGIERIAMLKHGVTDLRLFFDNDMRFAEQFR
jgi:phenylalanyl-tRNA synthetase alpha chain